MLVALMPAHRTGRDPPIRATFDQRDIARISPESFAIVPRDKPERFDQVAASTIPTRTRVLQRTCLNASTNGRSTKRTPSE